MIAPHACDLPSAGAKRTPIADHKGVVALTVRIKENSFESSWAQGILTLVSVVLGSALAIAAQNLHSILNQPEGITLGVGIHAVGAFFVIVGTFYHCYTFTSFFHVLPSLLWVIIPTLIGLAGVMVCYSIGNFQHFLFSSIIFFITGILCFSLILFERSQKRIGVFLSGPAIGEAFRVFSREMIKNIVCFILMGCASAIIYFTLYVKFYVLPFQPELILALVNAPIYGFMIWWTEYMFIAKIQGIWSKSKLDIEQSS